MKKCVNCKIDRQKDFFWKEPRNKDGLNSWCKVCCRDRLRLFRKTPKGIASLAQDANNKRVKRQEQRQIVLIHYGKRCTCCGEDTEEFLSVDHIKGHGNMHRREIGHSNLYLWLIINNFPKEFQILCMNCNWGKRKNNICPHEKNK